MSIHRIASVVPYFEVRNCGHKFRYTAKSRLCSTTLRFKSLRDLCKSPFVSHFSFVCVFFFLVRSGAEFKFHIWLKLTVYVLRRRLRFSMHIQLVFLLIDFSGVWIPKTNIWNAIKNIFEAKILDICCVQGRKMQISFDQTISTTDICI